MRLILAYVIIAIVVGIDCAENPFNDTNLVSMFDGKTLNGWTPAKADQWKVENGTIHGTGTSRGYIYYKTQVGDFRWIFNVRQIKGNHIPTVLFWGAVTPVHDALGAIQFQPPDGGNWDYRPGHNDEGKGLFTLTRHRVDHHEWSQCEVIGNQTTGVARMACCLLKGAATCKGVQVVEFKDKTAGRVGPLAIQVHNAGINDEYKNLYLESPVVEKVGEFITV